MKDNNKKTDQQKTDEQNQEKFPGYPPYPKSEDIYSQFEKEEDVDPEDITREKAPNEPEGALNEKDFPEIVNGDDLDIPGAEELDDEQEAIGSEDEENNYYSLGGDNHEDLEEREDL